MDHRPSDRSLFPGVKLRPGPFMPGLARCQPPVSGTGSRFRFGSMIFSDRGILTPDGRTPDPISRWVRADGTKSIFPNWEADPEKESSYNFGPTDRIIGAISWPVGPKFIFVWDEAGAPKGSAAFRYGKICQPMQARRHALQRRMGQRLPVQYPLLGGLERT